MIYFLTLFSSFLALCLFAFNALAIDDYSVENFYKDPTYSHFIKSISNDYNFQCDGANDKLTVYATLVLKNHRDFAIQVVDDFASFDPCQQQVLCASLNGAGFSQEVKAINAQYGACEAPSRVTVENINNIRFLDTIESMEDQQLQSSYMDYCWASYFATGNENYIVKMVNYVKLHEEQSEHALIIAEFISASSILAQQDPAIDRIMTKYGNQLHCFR